MRLRWTGPVVLAGVSLLLLGTPLMAGVSAASGPTPPAWEPDANAAAPYSNLILYDAYGNEVTSGTNLSAPFAFAVATTPADFEATKATLYFALPIHGELPALWLSTSEAGPTTFSPAFSLPAGTPADVAADAPTYPVVSTSSASIASYLTTITPDTTAGYANTIQVRLIDSGPFGHGNATGTYWETDIGYNTTASPITVDGTTVPADGWAQLFPLVSSTTTSLTATPASGQVTLTATVTPASAAGVVQFFNGTTLLGDVTVASGTASFATPASANYNYTADFVPNLGETGAGTSAATIVGGSASNTVASSPAVTVTGFSPTRLGRGASGVVVTVTGTGFSNGAIVGAAGVNFTSVNLVNPTTMTGNVKVASAAPLGAATVTVTDSAGSATCTTCVTIVAAPAVKSISPSLLTGTSKSVTITGSGFAAGANLLGPAGVSFSKVKVVSSAKITATEKVASKAKAGKHLLLTVVNGAAGGEGRGAADVVTIFANPAVTSMTPSSLKPGATTSVTVKGTGFVSGATLEGPKGVSFSKVRVASSTKITATAKVSANAKAGKRLAVTVVNGVAGGKGVGTGKVLTIS